MVLAYKKTPWPHQKKEIDVYWMAKNRFLWWYPRTGKSLATIAAASLQYLSGGFRHLLIVAPSTVQENWGLQEFPAHCVVPYSIFTWNSQRMRTKRGVSEWERFYSDPGSKLKVFTINFEALLVSAALERIRQFLCLQRCGLVIDEVHHLGEPGSRTTKRMRSLSKYAVWRRILTGTPTHNSPIKLYSICNMLESGILGFPTAQSFRDFYCVYEIKRYGGGGGYAEIKGYQNLDDLMSRLVPFTSLVGREDLGSLPALLVIDRSFELTEKQRTRYAEIEEEARTRLREGNRMAFGASISKLIRTASNVEHPDEENPRFAALQSVIAEATPGEKMIIWCLYTDEIKYLETRLGSSCVTFYGETPWSVREGVIHRFNTDPTCQFFVANPQAIGEGRSLGAANVVVWFSLTFDNILYGQAAERASLAGKENVAVFRLLAANTVEPIIARNLQVKDARVGSLCESLEGHFAKR